jgi:type I restriction enzyme S subunit
MILNKATWKEARYGDYVDHIEIMETNPDVRKSSRYVSVEHIETGDLKVRNWIQEEMPTFFRKFKSGQILFGKRRAYQRKVAIADFDGICSPHIWALQAKGALRQEYLPLVMLTEKFYDYVNANSAGTMSPYLKWPQLSKYTFLLPTETEQIKIVRLFQEIEAVMTQTEKHQWVFLNLKRHFSNILVSKKPEFGTVLKKENCAQTRFDMIADCIEEHDKQKSGVNHFIGLEHIEPENLKISAWGNIENGTTFTKRFSKDDVLFGKRRAYLKKVAIAEFDGICSSDILVLRAKKNKMLPELLPFYVSAEGFIDHAVSTSAGSLSPRTKWSALSAFEISVPNLTTQRRILEVLQQIEAIHSQLRTQMQTLKNLKQKLLNEILG